MNTTHNRFTRVLCTILSVALLISVIPLTVANAEDEAPAVVSFGTYSEKTVLWDVVKSTDSAYLLIAKNVLVKGAAAVKFTSAPTAFPDYETSSLAAYVTGTLLPATFSETQQAKLATFTTNYVASVSGTKTDKTYAAKMSIPSAADIPAAFLTKATLIGTTGTTGAAYWTADAVAANATDKKVNAISTSGTAATPTQNATTFGVRPVISIAKADLIALDVEGCSFTDANDNAINYVVRGEGFKVTLDEAYNQSTITVKNGETALTADENNVYTVPADATGIAIEGVQVNPADFTAYDEALAAAKAIDASVYDEATFAPVKELLDNELDKDTLTGADQATIDQYVTDLNAAVANLPADFRAYDEALTKLTEIKTKGDAADTYDLTPNYIFDADYTEELTEGVSKSLSVHIATVLNRTYKEATIHAYKIDQQAEVDKATAAYNLLISKVGYLSANTTNWLKYKEEIMGLDDSKEIKWKRTTGDVYVLVGTLEEGEELEVGRDEPAKFLDVAEAKAACEAIVAEHDYVNDPVDCTHQAEVDDAAARLKEIYEPYSTGEKYAPTNFDWLDDILAAAEAINLDDYITTEEFEADGKDEKTDEFVNAFYYGENGANADSIRDAFSKALDEAKSIDRDANGIKYQSQSNVDDRAEALAQNMVTLASLRRLTKMEKINMKIRAFFQKIVNFFRMISEITKTLWNLLGMLFRGEIDLYSVFEMIGLDQKYLDILMKLGIKPMEPEEPEEPEEPAASAKSLVLA